MKLNTFVRLAVRGRDLVPPDFVGWDGLTWSFVYVKVRKTVAFVRRRVTCDTRY